MATPTTARFAFMSDAHKAHLAMLLFAALIAYSFSLGKLATPYIGSVPLNGARFFFATLVMGVVAFGVKRAPLTLPMAPWRFGILGALMAVYFVTMFIALTITSPVGTSAVFTLIPIMTAFFGYLILKQLVPPVVGVSLIFAGLGSIWVIFRGDLNAILNFDIGRGELIFFIGCICYALYAPLLRLFNRGEPLTVLTFFTIASTTLWVVAYGWQEILAVNWLALPPIVWWALAYLAIFPTAVTFFLVQYAAMRLPASKVLAYGYLVPSLVILYEGLAGRGWVSLSVLIGALVTVLGLLVLALLRDAP